jgi:hypothetical protein
VVQRVRRGEIVPLWNTRSESELPASADPMEWRSQIVWSTVQWSERMVYRIHSGLVSAETDSGEGGAYNLCHFGTLGDLGNDDFEARRKKLLFQSCI